MKNQLDLFNMDEVPKGTKDRPPSTSVSVYKSRNRILTNDAGKDMDPKDCRWLACQIPPKRLDNGEPIAGMSLGEMMGHFCRLLDEGGWTAYGATEREAVIACAKKREIPCDL